MQKEKRHITLFTLVTLMYWFSLYTYVPILSPYVEYLGGSLQMVGLVIGSYGVTQMLLRIPLGLWSDRLGRRKVFVSAGAALALVSALGMGLAGHPWSVFMFRSLSGVAAASWVAYTVLFSSYFRPEQAAQAMGILVFYLSLGQMLGTTMGGFVADYFGWEAPFFLAAGVALLAFIVSTRVREGAGPTSSIQVRELLQVGRDPLVLMVSFLAVLLQCMVFSTVFGFTPMHAVAIGASRSELSILALLSTLPAAISALKSSQAAAFIGERRALSLAFITVAVFSAIIPFMTQLWALYITQAAAGFGRGLVFPLLMGMSIRTIAAEKRATAMGFFQSIYALGMFVGPVIVGVIGEHFSLAVGFISVGILGFVAAALCTLLARIPSSVAGTAAAERNEVT